MPKFNKDNIQLYVNELEMWQLLTELEKKKHILTVWISLPNDDPSNIKQSISNSIRIENLSQEDGMDKLIVAMKEAFQKEDEIEAFLKWKEFVSVKRKEGEDVQTFINRLNTA